MFNIVNMKKVLLALLFVFCSTVLFAQTDLSTQIKETAQSETIAQSGLVSQVVETVKKEVPVQCTGDSVTYVREDNTICGEGNVEVKYEDKYIRADKVIVNTKTRVAEAEGRVIVSDGTNIFTANKVQYNLATGEGEVDGISSRMGPWFAKGETAERVSKELYYIKNGYVTTCDYEIPHTRIKAKDLYIYPKDKIVAKHITFYWGKTPLFYWPYYKRSLKDKKSRWTIIPGSDNKLGKYLLTGYSMYWENFLGGTFQPILRLDYYEKRGPAIGLYGKYRREDKIETFLRSYLIKDKAFEDFDGVTKEKTRGRISVDHMQRLTDSMRAVASLNYLSDDKIVYDFFRDEFEDEIQTKNYINITKTARLYQLSLFAMMRFNKFYTVLERLPMATLRFLEHRIGKTSLYYKGYVGAGYLNKLYKDTSYKEDYASGTFDTDNSLRYPKKYFGWLNIIPKIGTRQTYYTKTAKYKPVTLEVIDEEGEEVEEVVYVQEEKDKSTWRSVYYTGIDFTTKISKVFYVQDEFWQVNDLRHLIEPRLNYNYQHEPSIPVADLLNFDDPEYAQNYFTLSLRNKLQTKRSDLSWDIIDFLIQTNYYPEQYEEPVIGETYEDPISGEIVTDLTYEKRSFSHITTVIELEPYDWLLSRIDANFDQYDNQVDSFSIEMVLYRNDKLSFGLDYRYKHQMDQLWTSQVNYTINSNWSIRMQHRFDFSTGELQKQEYILFRDMHCWNAAVTFRQYRDIDENAFFVVFYPKAYPNIPVTFGTTFFGRDETAEMEFGGLKSSVDYSE